MIRIELNELQDPERLKKVFYTNTLTLEKLEAIVDLATPRLKANKRKIDIELPPGEYGEFISILSREPMRADKISRGFIAKRDEEPFHITESFHVVLDLGDITLTRQTPLL